MQLQLVISIAAGLIALYAVLIQRKELCAQREELRKSAEANDKSQRALNKQIELNALACLLDAEIHMHNFNNKKDLNPAKQKAWAAKNLEEIDKIRLKIRRLVKAGQTNVD